MTPTPEPTELDCSAGAKMMIERMKTNPEDFEIGGKLRRVFDSSPTSARDKTALNAAFYQYIVEPKLMADVLVALTAPEETETETEMIRAYSAGRGRGKSVLGTNTIDPRALYNPNTETYSTATQQLISHEMIEQQRRHLEAHKENLRHLQEKAAAGEKLSWSEKFRSML
jgi:hypothetical protein